MPAAFSASCTRRQGCIVGPRSSPWHTYSLGISAMSLLTSAWFGRVSCAQSWARARAQRVRDAHGCARRYARAGTTRAGARGDTASVERELASLLEELHRRGREHDAGQADRLQRWRNLEPDTAPGL